MEAELPKHFGQRLLNQPLSVTKNANEVEKNFFFKEVVGPEQGLGVLLVPKITKVFFLMWKVKKFFFPSLSFTMMYGIELRTSSIPGSTN